MGMKTTRGLERLDFSFFTEEFKAALRLNAVHPKHESVDIPTESSDLEKHGLLFADDGHTLKAGRVPHCGKCLKSKASLHYIMIKPDGNGRSTTSRLCWKCGAFNKRLIRLERLRLPKEALNRSLGTFDTTDNPKLVSILDADILKANQGLYLYGDYGVGKTHLIYGIARELIWTYNRKVKLVNYHEHLESIKRSFDDKDHSSPQYDFLKDYNTIIIDEFGGGYEDGKKVSQWVKQTTSEMLMEMHKAEIQVILVSNIGHNGHTRPAQQVLKDLLEHRVLNRLQEICPVKYEMMGRSRRKCFFNN